MKSKVVLVCRLLLGALFLFSGVSGLMMVLGIGNMAMPPMEPAMATIMAGFMATKYMLPLVKLIEIVAGLLLISGKFQNLAIVLLGPIVVNIFLIHLCVERHELPMALAVVGVFGVIVWSRWDEFKFVLKA